MKLKTLNVSLAALIAGTGLAAAETPQVVADIAPVHSLVSMVMGDLGEADLILPPGASPHGYAMRPSSARALQDADLVFWVGEALTPWLERPLSTLPDHGHVVELMELPEVIHLEFREGADLHAAHGDAGHDDHGDEDHGDEDHGHDEHDHDDHGHDDHGHDHDDHEDHDHGDDHAQDEHGHDDHAHDDDHGHDDHDHAAEAGHEGHVHDGLDPHGWLDPENARIWLSGIAEALAEADPENAATYRANADAARAALAEQSAHIAADLEAIAPIRFLVYHDAYQYFENRFELTSSGAVSDSDATAPGAARVAELRDKVTEAGVDCLFTEPQFGDGLASSIFEESDGRLVEIDPLGTELTPGADLYPQLLNGMAASFLACKG